MQFIYCLAIILLLFSCTTKIHLPNRQPNSITGTQFYKQAFSYNWQQRDSLAVKEILAGNMPSFLKKFVGVTTQIQDSASGRTIKATYYVSPDYVSIGSNSDWARIPLTPMAAQKIADAFDCFLPTRKIVNDIYNNAKLKLEPVPMYAFRDSTPTMYHHHLIIEGQRKSQKGLVAGIKKDVVITGKILREAKQNRVAIYGWHKPDGKPIQPLYSGHVNWYVDYSHGIRLVYRKIKVGNKWLDYMDVVKNPVLQKLLCDEEYCDFYKYPY
ncbi:MAG: hypothetical protein ABR502_12555 [Chitinophagaceae bacterium]